VLHAKMLIPAKDAILLSSYTITVAFLLALLDMLLEDKPALNVILLAKLALLIIPTNVIPAPVLTNYGKEDA
jgi:hypothetical protein